MPPAVHVAESEQDSALTAREAVCLPLTSGNDG